MVKLERYGGGIGSRDKESVIISIFESGVSRCDTAKIRGLKDEHGWAECGPSADHWTTLAFITRGGEEKELNLGMWERWEKKFRSHS